MIQVYDTLFVGRKGYMALDIWSLSDHSDSERANPLLQLHGLFFLINSKGSFIFRYHMIIHAMAFVTPVVEHWLEHKSLFVGGVQKKDTLNLLSIFFL